MDLLGKKFSSTAAASIRAANALAIIGRYDRQMWNDIAGLINLVPEDQREDARKILLEGERAASETIDCALDIANTSFRKLPGAAVLRHKGWLKATPFRPEVQTKILDMAYDGDSLFGKHINDALLAITNDTDIAKSLGALQYRRILFRGRGFTTYRGGYQSNQQNCQYEPQYCQNYNKSSYRQSSTAGFSRQGSRKGTQQQGRDSARTQ